jgi:potassium-transporting ATPase KdpC subunit
MKTNLFPAIKLTLIMLIFFSGIYTLIVFGIGRLTPGKGKGEFIEANGKKYYANIGQSFTEDKYFNSRPSAVNYNAAGSGGSNKGPSNKEYLNLVQSRIDTFLTHNPGVIKSQIPVELVTASGSGLDPHISPKAARVQVNRIAAVRGIPEATLYSLVEKYTDKPLLGIMGPEKINVLKLNLALDQIK